MHFALNYRDVSLLDSMRVERKVRYDCCQAVLISTNDKLICVVP